MLTTRRVLFVQTGENATTPRDPCHEVVREDGDQVTYLDGKGTEVTVSLKTQVSCCISSDFDMLTDVDKYEVRDVVLPDWLSTREWLYSTTRWKWVWGLGADGEWPESWQRALADIRDTAQRLAAVKLLRTKNFRSDFRRKMRDQIVAWMETPADQRQWASPLSPRQWDAVIDTHLAVEASRRDGGLYRSRGFLDARPVA